MLSPMQPSQREKNLLVVKSTDKDNNVASSKAELTKVLKDVPIVDTKFTSGDNAVMNFACEPERQMAAHRISNGLENLEMNFTKKLHPTTMICNVSKEESKEDIVEYLVAKNGYLQSVDNVNDKVKLVFDKPANGNTVHYILKCTPDVRGMIHKHGDAVCLKWARYTVRDRYHVFNCYYCQRYGHSEKLSLRVMEMLPTVLNVLVVTLRGIVQRMLMRLLSILIV